MLVFAVGGCGGKAAIKTPSQARSYIEDVLRSGKNPNEFELADNATPVAVAARADAAPLKRFREVVGESADAACIVAGLVSDAADAAPQSVLPVTLEGSELVAINFDASRHGVSSEHTTRVLNAALEMSQSTWVEAAGNACDVAQSGI